MTRQIDRRTFIRATALGGGGMLLSVWLGGCDDQDPESSATTAVPAATSAAPSTSTEVSTTTAGSVKDPAAFWDADLLLRIEGDGTVTVTVPKSEMGQGVRTALAMIVAEELDANWEDVRVATALGRREYGDQVTGGSLSVSTRFDSMRVVGATARQMLIAAAAAEWDVDPASCTTEPGVVVAGEQRATYGALAELAARSDPPSRSDIMLKDPDDFRIIGTAVTSVDAPNLVAGEAIFGSDVVLPGMLYAVVARSPAFGGSVEGIDDSRARAIAGVQDVVEISTGVAVVAENTWAAMQGRDALEISWNDRGNENLDDAAVHRTLLSRLDPVAPGPGEITADYTSTFFAHSAIEPLVCVADVSDDHCEVWAATQDPQLARAVAGRGSGLPTNSVTVHVPLIGGGFGRRLDQDFVEEAAELSAALHRPIKLFWSRTDDLRNDRYHPSGVSRAVGDPVDPAGLRLDTQLAWNEGVPTGNWRSVTNATDAFPHECFIDELAFAAGADPYEYRRPLLNDTDLATLDLAATSAGWGGPLPEGWGRGIAFHSMWGVTPTTAVAEVSVDGDAIRVHRVVCAIHCGTVINPDSVVAQMEGAVAFGTSAALHGGVTVDQGGVVETNFNDSPILRFDEMPQVEVHIVPSVGPPTGVGEAGVPPIPPAIANAVFAATGRRLRDLPLSPS